MQSYRIPLDSSLRLLPLVYFLPKEMFIQCPTLRKLPRNFSKLASSEDYIAIIESDQFLNEIMMAAARLVFPHFGLRGWVEHYTGHCPAWKLAYATQVWAKALNDEVGWGLQSLFNLPKGAFVPFFDEEYIREAMSRAVKRGLAEQNWQPILDIVREIPCHEDFEEWKTKIRIDFMRKWYHMRSKHIKVISLEECLEDEEHTIHEIEDKSNSVENIVVAEEFVSQFKRRLSAKDIEILELRYQGYTYEEIADKLGYKTHSAVVKRIKSIAKAFEKYEDEITT